MDADTESFINAMHVNADRISNLGQYIGLFEWCLVAWYWRLRVIVHMGRQIIEVTKSIIPSLHDEHLLRVEKPGFNDSLHVGWCRAPPEDDDEPRMATPPAIAPLAELFIDHTLNHFVFLQPLPGASPLYVENEVGDMTWRTYLFNGLFLLVDTVCQGDCSMDCIGMFLGMARKPKIWKELRVKLFEHTIACTMDPVWRTAFLLSGEMPTVKAVAPKPKKSVGFSPALIDKIRKGYMRWKHKASEITVDAESVHMPSAIDESDPDQAPKHSVIDAPPLAVVEVSAKGADFKEEALLAICWSTGCPNNNSESMPIVRRLALTNVVKEMDSESMNLLVEAWRQRPVRAPLDKIKDDCSFADKCNGVNRTHNITRLHVRVGVGKACQRFFGSPEGIQAKSKGVQWLQAAKHLGFLSASPTLERKRNSIKAFLKRSVKAAEGHATSGGQQLVAETSRGKSAPGWMIAHERHRFRKRGLQGRPSNIPELGHALYQWFVDVRGIARSRLRPRLVLAQAQVLQQSIVQAQIEAGLRSTPVVLDRKWLSAWCFKWGVIMRKPNRRFKVKRAVLKDRLCIYWSNIHAIRIFFIIMFGVDPVHEQYDQTGMHLNEAGSKNLPTLALPDQEYVALLENHMHVRSRISWVTCTFSDRKKAKRKEPLEVMLKGKTNRILAALAVPAGNRYTLQVGPKGSYREEHMITFLERHLPLWDDDREEAKDYRICGLDAYAPHKSERVVKLAWSRGYVAGSGSMVPAGGTGVVAGPDTDVHAWLESELQEVQSLDSHNKLMERPHQVPSETPQGMINNAVMLWELFDHSRSETLFQTEWFIQ